MSGCQFQALVSKEYAFWLSKSFTSRLRWLRGLGRASAAARLLGLRVRIPPGGMDFVSCECCVLTDRGLCVRLITHQEENQQVWSVQ
jgi:hypothetical protein